MASCEDGASTGLSFFRPEATAAANRPTSYGNCVYFSFWRWWPIWFLSFGTPPQESLGESELSTPLLKSWALLFSGVQFRSSLPNTEPPHCCNFRSENPQIEKCLDSQQVQSYFETFEGLGQSTHIISTILWKSQLDDDDDDLKKYKAMKSWNWNNRKTQTRHSLSHAQRRTVWVL